jgi:hypothetical protein
MLLTMGFYLVSQALVMLRIEKCRSLKSLWSASASSENLKCVPGDGTRFIATAAPLVELLDTNVESRSLYLS